MAMGARIREKRLQLGMTLRELSQRSSVKESALGNLEQRNSKKSDRASAIAAALGVSSSWLLDGIADYGNALRQDNEAELLALWRIVEESERETFLSLLRAKVESYRRVAAHLASIGVNLEAPKDHIAPFPPVPTSKRAKN